MNLDQQIRQALDDMTGADCDGDTLALALRAVLDLPPMRDAVPSLKHMAAGYNQALADVRVEIADRLGIQPPAEGATWAAERHSGADLGAVVSSGTDQHGNFRTQDRP